MAGRVTHDQRPAQEQGVADARLAQIAANLARVRERITAACGAAGRSPDEVHLIVVTKTYPAADVLRLAGLGVADVGENRDQEAAGKAAEVVAAGTRLRWHFVGRLQRNKVRSVVTYADVIHSVDSVRLVAALATAAATPPPLIEDHVLRGSVAPRGATEPQDLLVQVSLDGDTQRGGAAPEELDRVLEAAAAADSLRLRGLMAVAPLDWEPERAFAALAAIHARVRKHYPDATMLSAGMSGDLEQAIAHGATHVRVGSAVLGERPLR